MNIPDEHLGLFKADWIGDPGHLKTLTRRHKYNDLFTAEIAAWCTEVHEHLRDLEARVGVELVLRGGNAASLRFVACPTAARGRFRGHRPSGSADDSR